MNIERFRARYSLIGVDIPALYNCSKNSAGNVYYGSSGIDDLCKSSQSDYSVDDLSIAIDQHQPLNIDY